MSRGKITADAVEGVIFDMDGTLVDSPLDFACIRREARVPEGTPILEYMASAVPEEAEHTRVVLARHEKHAAEHCTLREDAREVLQQLRRRGLALALLTRNCAESMRVVTRRFGLRFDACVSREDAEPKPSPEPVLKIARDLHLEPSRLLVVGDYVFDLQAGRAAGSHTALLRTPRNTQFADEADAVIESLTEVPHLIG